MAIHGRRCGHASVELRVVPSPVFKTAVVMGLFNCLIGLSTVSKSMCGSHTTSNKEETATLGVHNSDNLRVHHRYQYIFVTIELIISIINSTVCSNNPNTTK